MKYLGLAIAVAFVAISASAAQANKCSPDSVRVGTACIDKYEESVWSTTDAATIKLIKKGKAASASDLGSATEHGAASDDYGAGCPDNAAGCVDYYAVSIPGVLPSTYITWFQAAAACRNAGKRLASNYEWQIAAFGTPDPGTDNGTTDCNVNSALTAVNTGSRSGCVSDVGTFDMVGNINEWVQDWADRGINCVNWTTSTGLPGGDVSCFGGPGDTGGNEPASIPGALARGGSWDEGTFAGVFAISSIGYPPVSGPGAGFRCAR